MWRPKLLSLSRERISLEISPCLGWLEKGPSLDRIWNWGPTWEAELAFFLGLDLEELKISEKPSADIWKSRFWHHRREKVPSTQRQSRSWERGTREDTAQWCRLPQATQGTPLWAELFMPLVSSSLIVYVHAWNLVKSFWKCQFIQVLLWETKERGLYLLVGPNFQAYPGSQALCGSDHPRINASRENQVMAPTSPPSL